MSQPPPLSRCSRKSAYRVAAATVGIALAASTMTALTATGASAAQAGDGLAPLRFDLSASDAESGFANPRNSARPLYRFWHTGGLMTPESVARQVQQIRSSGAGGFEANQLTGAVESAPGYDAETMDWGTDRWTRAQQALFDEGRKANLRVDSIYTPGWSAGTQTVRPDGVGSAKELTFGSVWVDAGDSYRGEVPKSTLPDGVKKRVLQGVVAYRCERTCSDLGEGIPILDPRSADNLTAQGRDDTITWTAPGQPDGARYVIVSSWSHGTGQTVELAKTADTTFLVDHFAPEGFEAIRDYTEEEVMTPALRASLRRSGGSLFFDSLELNRLGVQVRSWTPRFLREFEERQGYSLVPYLASVAVTTPVFDFTGTRGDRIREDYNQTLSDLFRDYHLLPLKRYADSYNMTVRGQAYSSFGPAPIDISDMASLLDIPEGEDLSFNNGFEFTVGQAEFITTRNSDNWRALASATAQAGRDVISTECCALLGSTSVARQKLLAHVNQQFSVGVNQIVWHGWADQSPGAATTWPGFAPFSFIASDLYGPQNPTFADDRAINTYVGRMQTVLRRGTLRNDIAVYRDDNNHTPTGSTGQLYFADQSLARAGYSYGFLNDTMVKKAQVRGGRLEPKTLGYKAFVLDNTSSTATNPTMSLGAARRVLKWARQGLPVVVVGKLPNRVRGYHPKQDKALARTNRQLLATPGVRRVPTQVAVLSALRAAGVYSAVRYAKSSSPLVALQRRTNDSNYYHLFNSATRATSTRVTLQGRGRPYNYNAWTGQVIPVAEYTRTRNGVQFEVALTPGNSAIYAVTTGNGDTPRAATRISARSTTADEVAYRSGGDLIVRDSEPGTYRVRLSNKRLRTIKIADVPDPQRPAVWNLAVTSWQAGVSGPNSTAKIALPRIPLTALPNGELPDWLTIPGLQNKSGIGTYTTTIDVGPRWTGGRGARLSLGVIRGLARVSVNGRALPRVNQLDPSNIDLAGFLKAGTNTIQVRLSTLLGNAAYPASPWGEKSYGLIGPVVVTPYGTRTVQQGD